MTAQRLGDTHRLADDLTENVLLDVVGAQPTSRAALRAGKRSSAFAITPGVAIG